MSNLWYVIFGEKEHVNQTNFSHHEMILFAPDQMMVQTCVWRFLQPWVLSCIKNTSIKTFKHMKNGQFLQSVCHKAHQKRGVLQSGLKCENIPIHQLDIITPIHGGLTVINVLHTPRQNNPKKKSATHNKLPLKSKLHSSKVKQKQQQQQQQQQQRQRQRQQQQQQQQ